MKRVRAKMLNSNNSSANHMSYNFKDGHTPQKNLPDDFVPNIRRNSGSEDEAKQKRKKSRSVSKAKRQNVNNCIERLV
jgi:hypothetical protein